MVGTETEAMVESCLLACFYLIYFSYTAQTHLPRDGASHSGPNLPISIINQVFALQMWS